MFIAVENLPMPLFDDKRKKLTRRDNNQRKPTATLFR
jgi:hypothetical protein